MEEILELMVKYKEKKDHQICVRLYCDGSGVVTYGHSASCGLNDAIMKFYNLESLKTQLNNSK